MTMFKERKSNLSNKMFIIVLSLKINCLPNLNFSNLQREVVQCWKKSFSTLHANTKPKFIKHYLMFQGGQWSQILAGPLKRFQSF